MAELEESSSGKKEKTQPKGKDKDGEKEAFQSADSKRERNQPSQKNW